MHPEAETIAKIPKLKSTVWMTNQMTLEGADLEAWSTDEKQAKWREFANTLAKEDTNMCMFTMKYSGWKDADAGTTNRDLSREGGCLQGDAKFGLQGWDLEGATISEDGKSVVVGISKDLKIAPRWEEGEEYVFAVNL